ncbi:MAG: DUF484 family protein [Pseudomonadota bacterium]
MKSHVNLVEDGLEKALVEYLRRHPDFFQRHRDLLAEMNIPHSNGNVVSLIERQVEILRQQNSGLKKQLHDLVEIARDNDLLGQRMHQLTLALLHCQDRAALTEVLRKSLHDDFAADAVRVRFFDQYCDGSAPEPWQALGTGLTARRVRCGKPSAEEMTLIFGEMAESIGSVAVILLGTHGVLAIGSHDEERFDIDIGTDYLVKLGEIIAATLDRL